MVRSLSGGRRLAHVVLLVGMLLPSLVLAASAPRGRSIAGNYEAGPSRLALSSSGQFRYDGGHSCFIGYSDAGIADAFSGRYRLEGDWLLLEQLQGGGHIEGCSIDLKLFVMKVGAGIVLLGEGALRQVVNQRHSGRPTEKFHPFHRAGEPAEFSKDPEQWLPPPYDAYFKTPPRSGKVIEVGEVSTGAVHGSAGRVLGQRSSARLKVDLGRRDGAFKGMKLCPPGSQASVFLDAVEDDSATLTWSWPSPDGTAPTVGMPFTAYCP